MYQVWALLRCAPRLRPIEAESDCSGVDGTPVYRVPPSWISCGYSCAWFALRDGSLPMLECIVLVMAVCDERLGSDG